MDFPVEFNALDLLALSSKPLMLKSVGHCRIYCIGLALQCLK